MTDIAIPFHYSPRQYQLPAWFSFQGGTKRLVLIWHRRSGKDKTCWNMLIQAACERVGYYVYIFPSYAQGKKVIWEGIDKDGLRFLDHIPKSLRQGEPNQTEMKVRLWNGSLIQILGSDNYDSLMGTNPVGIVFSEYALQDPRAWDYIRPILAENGGFAIFNGTPRGKQNHLYTLYKAAKENEGRWFVSYLPVTETFAISAEDMEQERKDGMDEETFQQEFYCSWDTGMAGAYYSRELKEMDEEGRIGDVPYDPSLPVDTWWDLGIGDAMAIVFTQTHLNSIRMIDYLERSGEGLRYYAKELAAKPYVYGEHIAPHDISVRELGTGRSRLEMAAELGIRFKVARKLPIDDGIAAVRMMLPQCWIDRTKCAYLIEALASYVKEYDFRLKRYNDRPLHNWASHCADAVRTGAVGRKRAHLPKKAERYQSRYRQRDSRSWMSA